MHPVDIILGSLAFLSCGILLWQWLEAVFWRKKNNIPKNAPSRYVPSITLFKPVKGCEARTIECLTSWLEQRYEGKLQFLFGVASEEDPIVPPLRKLLQQYPHIDAELHICSQDKGFNKKVSTLIQLEPLATGEVWIVSDADVLVPENLLNELCTQMAEPGTVAVNCLYQLKTPPTLATAFETIAVNADFWSQVTQSLRLGEQDFCLGAVITVNAEAFKKTGGFTPLADLLADDYHIGHRLHQAGGKIRLSSLVVDSIAPKATFSQTWKHQLRWARTIRFERPIAYALSVLSNAGFWSISWLLLGQSNVRLPITITLLLIRIMAVHNLQKTLAHGEKTNFAWMAPAKDLFQFAILVAAYIGSTVHWRGNIFTVHKGGKITLKSTNS